MARTQQCAACQKIGGPQAFDRYESGKVWDTVCKQCRHEAEWREKQRKADLERVQKETEAEKKEIENRAQEARERQQTWHELQEKITQEEQRRLAQEREESQRLERLNQPVRVADIDRLIEQIQRLVDNLENLKKPRSVVSDGILNALVKWSLLSVPAIAALQYTVIAIADGRLSEEETAIVGLLWMIAIGVVVVFTIYALTILSKDSRKKK